MDGKLHGLMLLIFMVLTGCTSTSSTIHVWEKQELVFQAEGQYGNPYADVEVWIELQGPGFSKRVYGFWDGGQTWRVRLVATEPGEWTWHSVSNPPDAGLSGKTGRIVATPWTDQELTENPNRRGFLRPTANGHAVNYADGTPFFYLPDTWWACSTWRYPFKGVQPDPDYVPGPGIGFEEALQFRKRQGYNGVTMIAAYPSWHPDGYPINLEDANGVTLRSSWHIGEDSSRMTDEAGNRPFHFPGRVPGFENIVPDFDRINPAYFQSLDKKMQYLSDEGFVPFFEAVRRDHGPSWKQYYEWPGSYVRYVQYLAARYGCYNMIFSGVHADYFPRSGMSGADWNAALTAHYQRYGRLPFGQFHTNNIYGSTYRQYGHGADAPWLTMHGVGNAPRDHGQFPLLTELFHLPNPYPALNNESYYTHSLNPAVTRIHGDPISNTRASGWGSVLNGGLTGYVFGTQGYYVTTGEPPQNRPYIWDALNGEKFREIGVQMPYLKEFMLSEGPAYQDLMPDRAALDPCEKSPDVAENYLSGWASLMRTPDAGLIVAYFEVDCPIATIKGLTAGDRYRAQWFDPRTGAWSDAGSGTLTVGGDGTLQLPQFPGTVTLFDKDWALKLKRISN